MGGPIIRNACLVKRGRSLLASPMALAPLATQLISRQRRLHVLEILVCLSADFDLHQALVDSQFMPRLCCYLGVAAARTDSLQQQESKTTQSSLLLLQSLSDPDGFHPLFSTEAIGLSEEVGIRDAAVQLFSQLGSSETGKFGLLQQRVIPVLRQWRDSEVEDSDHRKASLNFLCSVVAGSSGKNHPRAANPNDAQEGEILLERPMMLTLDKENGAITQVKLSKAPPQMESIEQTVKTDEEVVHLPETASVEEYMDVPVDDLFL